MNQRAPLLFVQGLALCVFFQSAHQFVSDSWNASAQDPVTAKEVLAGTSAAFNQVAGKATPAVVSINAVKTELASGLSPLLEPEGPFAPPGGPPSPTMGIGSGVVIRNDGVIITNNHVVSNAQRVLVAFDDKKQYRAKVIGSDSKTDIAVLKLEEKPPKMDTISLGNSDTVKVGDWAIAIGNPFGLSHTVTSGIISAKGRGQMGVLDIEDFIQTDAAINPGNSGGPLLNLDGEMIGLNAAIFSQSGGFIGIGFSIPSNLVKKIADEIIATGHVTRGWLGILTQDIDPELSAWFKVPQKSGALVSQVTPGSPAEKGSTQVGDVILRYDGRDVKNSSVLKELVSLTRAGKAVPLEVIRNGQNKTLTIAIQNQPRESGQLAGKAAQAANESDKAGVGVSVQDVPEELESLGLHSGDGALVVAVKPGSLAFDSGLLPGDVILKANDKKIKDSEQFIAFGRNLKHPAVLYIQRQDKRLFVPLKTMG